VSAEPLWGVSGAKSRGCGIHSRTWHEGKVVPRRLSAATVSDKHRRMRLISPHWHLRGTVLVIGALRQRHVSLGST